MTLADRYWAKVDVRGPDECWPWLGSRNREGPGNGHGRIRCGSRTDGSRTMRAAHRVGYELFHGTPVPPDAVVRHNCDNPICQNPAHLEIGSQADNIRDMCERGRARPGGAKLSEDDVLKILTLLEEGRRRKDVATLFGISHRAICAIATGDSWRQLQAAVG